MIHQRIIRMITLAFGLTLMSIPVGAQEYLALESEPAIVRILRDLAAAPEQHPAGDLEHWQRQSRAVADGIKLGTNAWPALDTLVGLAGHSSLQTAVSAARILTAIGVANHPRWPQIQAELRGNTNVVPALQFLIVGQQPYFRPDSPTQRPSSIRILAAVGPAGKQAIPTLIKLFDSKSEQDATLWSDAAIALRALNAAPDDYLPKLMNVLTDANGEIHVRVAAAQALGAAGNTDPGTLAMLREQLASPYSQVRVASARALWRLEAKPDELLRVLIPLLRHKLPSVRTATLEAFSEMGPAATAAAAAIEELSADPRESVRTAAAAALKRIGGATLE